MPGGRHGGGGGGSVVLGTRQPRSKWLIGVLRALQGGLDVLRIWESDYAVRDGAAENPLLLLSATRENLLPLAFGFVHAAPEMFDTAEAARLAKSLGTSLGRTAERPAGHAPLLVPG